MTPSSSGRVSDKAVLISGAASGMGAAHARALTHLKRGFGQVPLNRAAEAEEISPLVVYLVSDESPYVSGAAIAIDGGEAAGNNLRPIN
jgi:3alpha(or 20beta)-hydroxysteroid dehydrogenase